MPSTLDDLINFAFIAPITVDNTALITSSLPETDYTAWSGGTAYVIGNRAMITGTTHLNYECILGHTNKTPLTAANIGVYWIVVGATNRWKAFDKKITDKVIGGYAMSWDLLLPVAADAMALFGLSAGYINLRVLKSSTPRRNLSRYSEELDNGVHAPFRATVTPNLEFAPDLSLTADRLIEDGTAAATHGVQWISTSFSNTLEYTLSCYVRRGSVGTRNVRINFPSAAFTFNLQVTVDLTDGSIISQSAGTVVGVIPAFLGYWRIWIRATATASVGGLPAIFMTLADGTTSYNGDSASRLDVWGWQVDLGVLTDYQWITDTATWDTTNWLRLITIPSDQLYYDSEQLFTGVPGAAGDTVKVVIYALGGAARVGEIVIGQTAILGELVGGSASLLDFSQKDTDTFGNVSVIARANANIYDFQFAFPTNQIKRIRADLRQFLAQPIVTYCVDDAANNYGVTIYGYYNSFDLPLTTDGVSFGTIAIEGLV